jgi:hypothetical protein
MKPPRLKILIAALVLIGLMIGLDGFLSTGGFGMWTTGTLICFFVAHFEFAGFQSSSNLPPIR